MEGWAPPGLGHVGWEKRGADGQAPTSGPEQMAEGIIKIQLCSHQRLGLKEEEAAGGTECGYGVGEGGVPKQCRVIVLHFGADFSAGTRT